MKVTAMKKTHSRAAGFSLLEVMIAVVVLAFGLISLAALQGRLFQSGAESKARAAATAIGQQVLEDARSFAFVTPPTGYTGSTYVNLASGGPWTFTAGGVEFTATSTVTRYRYDQASGQFVPGATDAYSGGVPEFKKINVSVGWTGSDGEDKTVLLTDSIAAVAPADAAMLRQVPTEASEGPKVHILRPDIGNPQVVPIAIGNDQSAASSNPKPQQFIEDISAATQFSVMTFTGSSDTVLLNRKLDVAAVSCVCQEGGSSSAANPAYQPVVWSGRMQAYQEPQVLPEGTAIGTAVVSNQDSEISTMCTVCCRDHHEAGRSPAVDPWRDRSQNDDSSEHYGYAKQGSSYNVGGGLKPAAEIGGYYVDACQIIRVGGRPRLARDLMQSHLLVTPLNSAKTGYEIGSFATNYATFVEQAIQDGMSNLPSGYPAPAAKFPTPAATPSNLRTTDPIQFTAAGQQRNLVAFGLYMDYLSPETRQVYECARNNDNSGDCSGLGYLEPLQVLPFYAVNVANLGSWTSSQPLVSSVTNTIYSNQGLLQTDGGLVTAQQGSSADAFPVTLSINDSNSGLAGTAPIDRGDEADSSYVADAQDFRKADGDASGLSTANLVVGVGQASILNLATLLMTADAANTSATCNYAKKTQQTTCAYFYVQGSTNTLILTITNYSTTAKVKGQPVFTDRKVCVDTDPRISVAVANDGTDSDTTTITITQTPLAGDYALTLNIVDQDTTCPTGTTPLTP